jgi:hypothetical protein
VAAIHNLGLALQSQTEIMGGRDKPGHDDVESRKSSAAPRANLFPAKHKKGPEFPPGLFAF